MAQTKKKRRTKHRGNAAGIVEVRGRTGRRPDASERKRGVREEARARREERALKPPTWRAALNRALISAVVFVVLVTLLFKQPIASAIPMGIFVLAFYIPLGYFTDQFVYKRKMRKLGQDV